MTNLPPPSNITAPTRFLTTSLGTYAYRRFGSGHGFPLLCLQHFTGTLDNWDSAVTDPLALDREVILFENAGIGRSSGSTPQTIEGMAAHAFSFLHALQMTKVDVLGYSLGGMVAQQMALEHPEIYRRLVFVGTAPEGGEDIMHLEKPELQVDPSVQGYERLVSIFFTKSTLSRSAGEQFTSRLRMRTVDMEPPADPKVARAQLTALHAWESYTGQRFAKLSEITHPCLVVNGVLDAMIPVRNSYMLAEHLPHAILVTFPDAGHGSLFQYHETFVTLVAQFLDGDLLAT
jgi:pimeloyl-ACP methyl ester carboxylesterase